MPGHVGRRISRVVAGRPHASDDDVSATAASPGRVAIVRCESHVMRRSRQDFFSPEGEGAGSESRSGRRVRFERQRMMARPAFLIAASRGGDKYETRPARHDASGGAGGNVSTVLISWRRCNVAYHGAGSEGGA